MHVRSRFNGGGRGIRTPKGLAARWISSPLPCQLRLALRARKDRYLRYNGLLRGGASLGSVEVLPKLRTGRGLATPLPEARRY
jgi:hypothetical protein